MKLEKAGIYVAENTSTEEQFLVNVIGNNPLLKIKSVISLSMFIQDITKIASSQNELITHIEENVNIFNWIPFQIKLNKEENTKTEVIENYKYLSSNRDKIIEAIRNNKENEVIIEFCKKEGISVANAWNLLKQFKLSL